MQGLPETQTHSTVRQEEHKNKALLFALTVNVLDIGHGWVEKIRT
jgi:hypothetical protein